MLFLIFQRDHLWKWATLVISSHMWPQSVEIHFCLFMFIVQIQCVNIFVMSARAFSSTLKAILLLQACTTSSNMQYQIQHKHNIQYNSHCLYLKIDMSYKLWTVNFNVLTISTLGVLPNFHQLWPVL